MPYPLKSRYYSQFFLVSKLYLRTSALHNTIVKGEKLIEVRLFKELAMRSHSLKQQREIFNSFCVLFISKFYFEFIFFEVFMSLKKHIYFKSSKVIIS